MTRSALDRMPEPQVAGLRWSVYARALAPIVRVDYDDALQSIADSERAPSQAVLTMRRAQMREDLTQAKSQQAEVRKLLLLDDDVAEAV